MPWSTVNGQLTWVGGLPGQTSFTEPEGANGGAPPPQTGPNLSDPIFPTASPEEIQNIDDTDSETIVIVPPAEKKSGAMLLGLGVLALLLFRR